MRLFFRKFFFFCSRLSKPTVTVGLLQIMFPNITLVKLLSPHYFTFNIYMVHLLWVEWNAFLKNTKMSHISCIGAFLEVTALLVILNLKLIRCLIPPLATSTAATSTTLPSTGQTFQITGSPVTVAGKVITKLPLPANSKIVTVNVPSNTRR